MCVCVCVCVCVILFFTEVYDTRQTRVSVNIIKNTSKENSLHITECKVEVFRSICSYPQSKPLAFRHLSPNSADDDFVYISI